MSQSAFLKEDLGPLLAKGLAAVATARPTNPAEYLGMWLLHQIQQRERHLQEVEELKQVEVEREEWARGRAQREKHATTVIQREWRSHLAAVDEQRQKEAALRELFASIEESAEEKVPAAEEPSGEGMTEQEREIEANRANDLVAFRRAQLFVKDLDKAHLADVRRLIATSPNVAKVIKCCFYAQGLRPRQIDSAEKIRGLLKPYPFTVFLQTFDPVGTPLQKKRMISRVNRLLSKVEEEALKEDSAAVHAIYQWLYAAVKSRISRDESIKFKKANGKETDEDYEEEEENEEEEKDPEEELIRQEELEIQRQLEAERAAEAAENEGAEE